MKEFRCSQREDVAAVSFAVDCCRNPTQDKKGCRERWMSCVGMLQDCWLPILAVSEMMFLI